MGHEMKGKIPKGATVDEWIEGLSPEQSAIIRELRKIIRKTIPQAREVIKYSWPWYEVNQPIAAIMVAGDHVNLELYRGTELKESKVLLEGTGKSMRHIKIFNVDQIKKLPIADLLKEAEELDAARKR